MAGSFQSFAEATVLLNLGGGFQSLSDCEQQMYIILGVLFPTSVPCATYQGEVELETEVKLGLYEYTKQPCFAGY